MTRCVSVFSLCTAMAAGVLAAFASPAQAADPRETEAARQFYAGRYQEALAAYVDLAVSTRNPMYMCEIGRCQARLGRNDEAVRNLKDCLSQAKLDAKKRREFKAMLTELESGRAAGPAAAAPPPAGAPPPGTPPLGQPPLGQPPVAGGPPPGFPQPPAPPPPGAYAPPGVPAGAPPAGAYPPPGAPAPPPGAPGAPPGGWAGYPPPGQPGGMAQPMGAPPGTDVNAAYPRESGGSNTAAYIIGGVGVLAAVGGGALGYLANTNFNAVEREYNAEKEKTGKRYNTLQFVGYGIGAAGITTAIILMVRSGGSERAEAPSSTRLSLGVQPNGVLLHGSF